MREDDRLTWNDGQGNWGVKSIPLSTLKYLLPKQQFDPLYGCLSKLRAYEDTGLSPSDVDSGIMTEAEKYKLALFAVIRNSKVMPVGLEQGRSMNEINDMSKNTMGQIMDMCDFDALSKLFYGKGRQS
jgi:hypothetical protein